MACVEGLNAYWYWQRQLHVREASFIAVGKGMQGLRYIAELEIAAPPQFVNHLGRRIAHPALSDIGDRDPARALIVSFEQIHHNGFEVVAKDGRLAPNRGRGATIVFKEIDVLLVMPSDDGRHQQRLRLQQGTAADARITVALPGTALIRLLFGLFDGGRHLGDGHQGPRDLVEQLVSVFLLCQ